MCGRSRCRVHVLAQDMNDALVPERAANPREPHYGLIKECTLNHAYKDHNIVSGIFLN